MQTMSATLEAAQQSASARPALDALLQDYWGRVARPRFQRFYSGSEDDGPVACVLAPDGSLVRARNDGGTLYVDRVASPDDESDYSNWTELDTGISAAASLAMAVEGSDILLVYVDDDDDTLMERTSDDNGASWSSESSILSTGAASKDHLALAVNSTFSTRLLLWSEGGSTVYRSLYSTGAWGSRTAWTHSVDTVSGIAVQASGDYQVIVTGLEATTQDAYVWAMRYGAGASQSPNTWGDMRVVASAAASAGVTYRSPFVRLYGSWWLFFVESFSGTTSYDRLQVSWLRAFSDFNSEAWREPIPFDYEGNVYGAAVWGGAGDYNLWLVSSDGVWASAVPALDEIDLAADVVEVRVDTDESGGSAVVELDNSQGQYTAYGADSLALLRRGARLRLRPGYNTSAGDEYGGASRYYWVESLELLTGPRARLVLRCRDSLALLEAWRARRQFVWASGDSTLAGIGETIIGAAGLEYGGVQGTALLQDLQPAWTLHPGESGLASARRLFATGGMKLWAGGGGVVYPTHADADDSTSYEHFGVEHAILEGRYRELTPAVNRARVVGAGVYEEAFDFDEIVGVGERAAQVLDLNLASADDAGDRADVELRVAAYESGHDVIRVLPHAGIEMYDVVEVTDVQAGLSGAKRRVLGYRWQLRRVGRPVYEMTIVLGRL